MPLDTKTGWKRPEFEELRDRVNQYFIAEYGEGIDLDDEQSSGMLSAVITKAWDKFEQSAEGVLHSLYVLQTYGGNLDNRAAEEGIARKPETYASTELQITGYLQASIPEGTEFSTETGQIFATAADVVVTTQGTMKDESGAVVPLVDDDGDAMGIVAVGANALEPGVDGNVMPNTIVNSEEALDGFYSVANPSAAVGGGPAETDQELQLRIIANRTNHPNSTDKGIETAVSNISGVKGVRLIDNRTMKTDSYGNPPKTLHLYVIGGDDQEVAQTYSDQLPPRTETVGGITATVTDDGNKSMAIQFDRAETVPVFITIGLKVDGTSFDTDNGPAAIKQNIVGYFDTLTMGSQVLYSKMFGPAYSPAGVNDVSVALGTTADNVKEQDIPVTDFQLAVTSTDAITITVEEV